MIISASGICLLRIVWLLLAVPVFPGFDTIIVVFPISWAATSVIFAGYYLQGGWAAPPYCHHGYAPEDKNDPNQG